MKKSIAIILLSATILWIILFSIDLFTVIVIHETPIFAQKDNERSFDDGGSGVYIGLGYSFDIMGNFMEFDELSGVMGANVYLYSLKVGNYQRKNVDYFENKVWYLWRETN